MGILDWLKKKITGGSSSNKIKEANRTSYYGGGVSSKKTQNEIKTSINAAQKKQEKKKKKEQQAKQQAQTTAFKSYDPKTKKIAETREKREEKKAEKPDAFNRKNAFKATPPELKQEAIKTSRENMQKQLDVRLAKKNAAEANKKERVRAAERLKVESGIDKKYSGTTAESRRRIKMGEYMSDPDVAKYEYLKHPVASSLARGGLSGTTFGLSELAVKRLPQSKEMREAEATYQANKSRAAETAGSMAGSLLAYGGTAGGFEKLGVKAATKAAESRLGKKLGAEALARTMAGSGAKAAITRSLVGDAIQDSTLGLIDTAANVGTRDDLETPRDYLEAIAKGQAANYAMGLAGNAVAHGLPVARRMWGDFADESRKLRLVPKGTMDFMDDFMNDVGNGTRRNLVMNGGTTKSTRLQGIQSEVGFRPKKLGEKAAPPKAEPQAVREPSEILQGYSSTGSKKRLADAQNNIKQHMANGDTRAARKEIERAVDDVVRNTKVVEPMDATIKEIKEELKNTRISISDKAKTDAGYKSGSFNAFRQKNFAAFRLTEDGTPVDDLWESLQKRYGRSLFPEDINTESEQLQYLADIAKSTDSKIDLSDEEIAYLKDELTNSLWKSANDSAKATEPKAPKVESKPKTEAKAEPPKARKRKPSKSEVRLEEVRAEMKALDDEIERLKASGEDTIETIRKWNDLHSEATKLRKNIDRAEKAREKRATDKAMKHWEESNAKADVEKAVEVKSESPKAEAKVEQAKAEEPETAIATRNDLAKADEETKAGAETGKQTKGERTEFKRGEEETAKEKARNKRAEKREQATQEGFDRDFAEFEKKVNENREKVGQLNGRLRAASTAEEKQAIKDEIKALDDEIKNLHRRASLRYHPDMGGTDEWMQRFNTAYDDYTKRVYSSRGFSGASSKSSAGGNRTRNNTYREYRQRYKNADARGGSTPPPRAEAGAGGGGSTPPPRGGRYADYDGLRRPKGYARRTQRAMDSVESMVGAKREGTTWRDAGRTFRDEADRKFVDSLKDFEQVARERLKTHGKEAMQKLYGAIDKARRYKAVASTSVGSHQMKWDGTRYQVKDKNGVLRDAPSIAEIFSGMDKNTEKSFNAYLFLKHNVDRLREGKPIFDNTVIYNGELSRELGLPKDIDLMDADVCKKLAQDYEAKFSDFQDRADMIRQFTANELNNRVHAGLLSKETMDEWLYKYPNYVPTYRAGLFDGVSAVKGSSVSPSDLRAAKGSDLNIYDLKEQLADATTRNWRDITLNNLLESTFGKNVARNMKDVAGSIEGAHTLALDHTMNVGKVANGGGYYAVVYRDGEAVRMPIEKRFYDDIKDLYSNGRMGNGLDVFNDKVLVPLANTWKKLITEWSPIFMVKNFMRDYPEAIINSRNRKEFLAITADGSALKDLLSNGKFSRSLQDAGISASTFIDVDRAVKAFEKGEGGLKTLIPRLNAGVEMYPRLVEYMATFKRAGYDLNKIEISDIPMDVRDMAAANAADVTVNFGRSGSVGKMINKGAIPFFNPSVQGWSKFARNISELDGFKDTVGFLLSATALGAAPMVATNLLYQNNPNYQQISARDKANNYIIAIPPLDDNADTFIKIPRSRFASVYGLPLVNVANENKMGWAQAVKVVQDQVAPINPLESHLGANLIQAAQNKSWYGTPIESEAMQSLPANERYDATTSGVSIKTAETLDKITKGKVKISPKKLDYVLDANLGVIADFGLPMTTQANKGTSIPKRIANVGKRAFTIDSALQNDLSSRYYNQAKLLEQNKNSSKATKADKATYEKFNSWNDRVRTITSTMRDVQSSNMPNKQEAYRELAKLRNETMQKALDGRVSVSNAKDISVVHKYMGTTYTIDHYGSATDKEAMKLYGMAKYGELSKKEMKKAIDADKDFYKGFKSINSLQNKLSRAGIKSDTTLSKAIALASVDANEELFGAYKGTSQSRTETANEMKRAKTYFKSGGSVDEFVKLEKCRKTLGKLPEEQRNTELSKLENDLAKGNITLAEYHKKKDDINYNADISYIGLATSLAQANSPDRGYRVYDIKDTNIRKGINIAAMGFTARDVRKMKKDLDTDGNGYPKKQEIIDYINKGDFKDKATLFDALYSYKGKYNPFGAVTNYTRAQAAAEGKKKGVEWITDETDDIETTEEASGGGYYRRGWGRWHRWGRRYGGGSNKSGVKVGSFKARVSHPSQGGFSGTKAPKTDVSVKSTTNAGSPIKRASTKATLPKASASSATSRGSGYSTSSRRNGSSGSTKVSVPKTNSRRTTARVSTNVKSSQSRVSSRPKMDVTPLNIKPVKASKSTKGYNSNLSAALKDIENTQKKVTPPKARRK